MWESNPPDFLLAREATTPCSPTAQKGYVTGIEPVLKEPQSFVLPLHQTHHKAPDRTRTYNLVITSDLRYQLRHEGKYREWMPPFEIADNQRNFKHSGHSPCPAYFHGYATRESQSYSPRHEVLTQ